MCVFYLLKRTYFYEMTNIHHRKRGSHLQIGNFHGTGETFFYLHFLYAIIYLHIITTRVPFSLLLPRRMTISLPRYELHDPTNRPNSTFCIYFLKSLSTLSYVQLASHVKRGECVVIIFFYFLVSFLSK